MSKRETGNLGEKMACGFLENNGYKVIETNYRCRHGEMDIIARQCETLVFVEVRTKKSYLTVHRKNPLLKRKKKD